MFVYRHLLPRLHARLAALAAVLRKRERMLEAAFRHTDALHAHVESRRVHHNEHVAQALVFLPEQRAVAVAGFAERHRAGRAAVQAELLLQPDTLDIIRFADRAVVIHTVLRDHEHR